MEKGACRGDLSLPLQGRGGLEQESTLKEGGFQVEARMSKAQRARNRKVWEEGRWFAACREGGRGQGLILLCITEEEASAQ